MDVKSELLWRIVVALASVFVVAKIMAFLFKTWIDNFFSYKKEKKAQEDLDERIKTMVERIEQGNFGATKEGTKGKSGTNSNVQAQNNGTLKKRGFLDQYLDKINEEMQHLQKLNRDKDSEYLNLKEISGIFENAQWGSGNIFQFLVQELSKNLSLPPDQGRLSRCVMELIREEAFFTEGKWILYKDILRVIKSRFVLENLVQEIEKLRNQDKNDYIFSYLASHYKKDKILLARAFKLFLGKVESRPWRELLKEIEQGDKVVIVLPQWALSLPKKTLNKIIFGQFKYPKFSVVMKEKVLSYHDIFHLISREVELIEKIESIQVKEEVLTIEEYRQVEKSLKILGCSWESTDEEIKSAFNQLAKRNHPDRMSGMNVPPEKMKIVNEKFAEIKDAYDLVRENFKKRKVVWEILKN